MAVALESSERLVAPIGSAGDLVRSGRHTQSEFGKVSLPVTVLRRFDFVLVLVLTTWRVARCIS